MAIISVVEAVVDCIEQIEQGNGTGGLGTLWPVSRSHRSWLKRIREIYSFEKPTIKRTDSKNWI